jgi:hypothetical protein
MQSDFRDPNDAFYWCRSASTAFVKRGSRPYSCWEPERRQTCVVLSGTLHLGPVDSTVPRNRNAKSYGSHLGSGDSVFDSRLVIVIAVYRPSMSCTQAEPAHCAGTVNRFTFAPPITASCSPSGDSAYAPWLVGGACTRTVVRRRPSPD